MINRDGLPSPRTPGSVILAVLLFLDLTRATGSLSVMLLPFHFVWMEFPSSTMVNYRFFLPRLSLMLFLGQEQGYQGGMDPYNREA